MKSKNTKFLKISEVTPKIIQRYMLGEIGDKASDCIYNNLVDLEKIYPDFNKWFYDKVVKDIENQKINNREIIFSITETNEEKYEVSGIVVLKKDNSEKKICTFRVHEDYRRMGIGTKLFEESFKYLGTRTPIISISDKNLNFFEYHIDKYSFVLEQELSDYYLKGVTEYVYNGKLK